MYVLTSQNTFLFLKLRNTAFLHKTMEKHIWIYISDLKIFFPWNNEDMKILSFFSLSEPEPVFL